MNKKVLITSYLFLIFAFISLIGVVLLDEYKAIREESNTTISNILTIVQEQYPDVTSEDLAKILNSSSNKPLNKEMQKYGLLNDDTPIMSNLNKIGKETILKIIFLFLFGVILIIILNYLNTLITNSRIKKLTNILSRINNGDYSYSISENKEDNISILQNEIYKSAINLRELALREEQDKKELKKSLEDISHQIKTPLAAITISLDNILLSLKHQNKEYQQIVQVKKEINRLNFLIKNLLKLSSFDVNAVNFNINSNKLDNIINQVILNLEPLCDLKNVTIKYEDTNISLLCDYNWEVEAITNIVKNSVEHSQPCSEVKIVAKENKLYTEIIIIDTGSGISKEDIPHIFRRFYRGKSSNKDSFGIGLSLAKSIIEKDNGKISVNSKIEEGTTFTIKYFKR